MLKWAVKARSGTAESPLWMELSVDGPTLESVIKAVRELSPDAFIYSVTTPKPVPAKPAQQTSGQTS